MNLYSEARIVYVCYTEMNTYPYHVVDVFTRNPLEGNALAVFPNAAGLDDATMQKIAKEMNLSETTFVLPATQPGCAANVRIFAPVREMIFAGHPTIGTAFVLLEKGNVLRSGTRFALQEKIGAVPIRVEAGASGRPLIWLTTPPIEFGGMYDRRLCAQVLGLDLKDLLDIKPQIVGAGNPTIFVALRDKRAVDRAWLDMHGFKILARKRREATSVFVFAPTSEGAYSRMFGPNLGVPEDPASGSLTGPLAAFMIRHGLASGADGTRLVSEQGTKMGRRSLLHIHIRGKDGVDGIDIGGYVTPVAEGVMRIHEERTVSRPAAESVRVCG